ncbi:MAG: GDSL-type esterase/lipase family protein [Thermoleophilia bacterium]
MTTADRGTHGPVTTAGEPRLGLVALGDSITVGEGTMALGVTPLSWAQWLARALDLPFTSYAVNGATTGDVLGLQLARVRAPHDVAALYVGVNDVRAPDFDAAAYERDLDAVAAGLAARADRLLILSLPEDLGRPTSAPKPAIANGAVRRVAARHGAALADLADFGGWTHVLPDAVHPTAIGQLEIADRAARALGATLLPSALLGERRGHVARYAPHHARALVRDVARRARERLLSPR